MIKLIDILTELGFKYHEDDKYKKHYEDRIKDRVDNIKKVIVPKEALGNFTLSQIQEPLIKAIQKDLHIINDRMLRTPDFAKSENSFVAYKIFTPFIRANRINYPITIETDAGTGTYYYIVINDNNLSTIIISDYENLRSKVEDHVKRVYPNDFKKGTPIKVISSISEKVIFNLPELMGTVKKPEKVLEKDLPYVVRTDYRIGANFEHIGDPGNRSNKNLTSYVNGDGGGAASNSGNGYGIGTITATSSGNAGKADSRGILTWIDVDFGKPFLSGGKLQKTRRFTNIYAKPYFTIPVTENKEIKNIEYYQQLLKNTNVSPSTYKFFQDVINSVKSKNGSVTEKQWNILQRIKTGDFKYHSKN